MIGAILFILIALWFLGFINLPFLPISDIALITFLGITISLYDLLIFLVIIWLIGILPKPFRIIASILLAVWLLSFFGLITIAGISLSNLIVLVIIFGLVYYLLTGGH